MLIHIGAECYAGSGFTLNVNSNNENACQPGLGACGASLSPPGSLTLTPQLCSSRRLGFALRSPQVLFVAACHPETVLLLQRSMHRVCLPTH